MAKRFDYCERRRLARRDGKEGYDEFIWILSLCLDPNKLGKLEHFYHHLETFVHSCILPKEDVRFYCVYHSGVGPGKECILTPRIIPLFFR
jgi:hypothetical protein